VEPLRPDRGGAPDRIHSFQQAAQCNGDKLKAEVAIDLFMHSFETQGLLAADPPRFGRRDEAKIVYEEDTLLIDRLRFDAFQLARKRVRKRVSEVDRQGSGADDRAVVKLYLVGLARGSKLPLPLQFSDRIDERGKRPRFGDAARLLQCNDIGGRSSTTLRLR
jgi:hypothetical protein